MVRSLALVFGSAFFIGSVHADLLLAPKVAEYKGDGATFRHLEFFDGGKKITYESPRGWECFGNSTELTLRPPNKTRAQATIARFPLLRPGCFDQAGVEKLTAEAIAQVPQGSENISIGSQEKNLLMIEHKETFLIILRYTFYGEKFARSILFLNRGREQVRFQLTCREADFKELHTAFLRSQYTWQNL